MIKFGSAAALPVYLESPTGTVPTEQTQAALNAFAVIPSSLGGSQKMGVWFIVVH